MKATDNLDEIMTTIILSSGLHSFILQHKCSLIFRAQVAEKSLVIVNLLIVNTIVPNVRSDSVCILNKSDKQTDVTHQPHALTGWRERKPGSDPLFNNCGR